MTFDRYAKKDLKGFTIVELIIGMVILSTLLALTISAINPMSQFAKTRNTKRRADVEALASAIHQYTAGNRGVLPGGITATLTPISNSGVNICSALVPRYLAALPQDPNSNEGARIPASQCTGVYNTGYSVASTGNGHFRVTAPSAELSQTIAEIR